MSITISLHLRQILLQDNVLLQRSMTFYYRQRLHQCIILSCLQISHSQFSVATTQSLIPPHQSFLFNNSALPSLCILTSNTCYFHVKRNLNKRHSHLMPRASSFLVYTCIQLISANVSVIIFIISEQCSKWRLSINEDKTKVIHFRSEASIKTDFRFMCLGQKHISY